MHLITNLLATHMPNYGVVAERYGEQLERLLEERRAARGTRYTIEPKN